MKEMRDLSIFLLRHIASSRIKQCLPECHLPKNETCTRDSALTCRGQYEYLEKSSLDTSRIL